MVKTYVHKPFKTKKYKPYELIEEYLLDIFKEAKEKDGVICFRSHNKHQSYLDVSKISQNIISEVGQHDYRDFFFTFSTFRPSINMRHDTHHLSNIFAWSIDVDYINTKIHPVQIYHYIMENVNIPTPNYIEYGNRLRLIYIFKEPLRLFSKQKDQLLKGFDFMQKCFCKRINDELSFEQSFGAESNPATSFFRIPGSINTKSGKTICLEHISNERYTLQELFEEWIPDYYIDPSGNKTNWYQTWKNKTFTMPRHNIYLLWEKRMETLRSLRTVPNIPRKRLCFIYGVGLLWTKQASNSEEVCKQLCEFNKGFLEPLNTRTIYGHFKDIKAYKFSDQYICETLNIDRSYFAALDRKTRDHNRYLQKRKNQIRNEKTKKQEIDKRRYFILENRTKYSISELAQKLNVSTATIKRDLVALKNKINEIIDTNIPSNFVKAAEENNCQVLRIKTASPTQPFLYANLSGTVSSNIKFVIEEFDYKSYRDDKKYNIGGLKVFPSSPHYEKYMQATKRLYNRTFKCITSLIGDYKNYRYAMNLPNCFPLINFYIRVNKNEPPSFTTQKPILC